MVLFNEIVTQNDFLSRLLIFTPWLKN